MKAINRWIIKAFHLEFLSSQIIEKPYDNHEKMKANELVSLHNFASWGLFQFNFVDYFFFFFCGWFFNAW